MWYSYDSSKFYSCIFILPTIYNSMSLWLNLNAKNMILKFNFPRNSIVALNIYFEATSKLTPLVSQQRQFHSITPYFIKIPKNPFVSDQSGIFVAHSIINHRNTTLKFKLLDPLPPFEPLGFYTSTCFMLVWSKSTIVSRGTVTLYYIPMCFTLHDFKTIF